VDWEAEEMVDLGLDLRVKMELRALVVAVVELGIFL